jgi:hypothetical protein
MMHLRLLGVYTAELNHGPALVLEDDAGLHRLAIGMPGCEAGRPAHEIRRGPRCEPSIYTAAAALLGRLSTPGLHVWLDLRDGALVAELRWRAQGALPAVPCAPRDLVALAAVAGLPLVAGETLACQIRGCPPDGESAALPDARAWLDRVRPGDFAGRGPGQGDGMTAAENCGDGNG